MTPLLSKDRVEALLRGPNPCGWITDSAWTEICGLPFIGAAPYPSGLACGAEQWLDGGSMNAVRNWRGGGGPNPSCNAA